MVILQCSPQLGFQVSMFERTTSACRKDYLMVHIYHNIGYNTSYCLEMSDGKLDIKINE